MTPGQKEWIDNASYETLLRKCRFAQSGDPLLQGDTGSYFAKVIGKKKQTCDHVQASKNVGWER